ncbi:hypothetical protein [Haliscomenobacter sp.]
MTKIDQRKIIIPQTETRGITKDHQGLLGMGGQGIKNKCQTKS